MRLIVSLVMGFVVLEAALLVAWQRRTGEGVAAADLLPNLAAGFCLLVALRAALDGAAWHWLALRLLGAGAAHLLDLRRRWRRRDSSGWR